MSDRRPPRRPSRGRFPPSSGPHLAAGGTLAVRGPRAPIPTPEGPLAPVRVDAGNAATSLAALGPARTPAEGLFVRSHFPTPAEPATPWRLEVGGAVAHPRRWSLEELEELPQARVAATLECAGNSRTRFARAADGELRWDDRAVGAALWEGVRLSTLLDHAAPRGPAREVVFSGADRGEVGGRRRAFARSLSVPEAARGTAVVALRMNGEPLRPEHGGPVRLVVPGWYGMAWVKWLTQIAVRRSPFRGYYQRSRYVYRRLQDGRAVSRPVTRLRVKSIIVTPTPGERIARAPRQVVHGRAWSGGSPVTRVDVDVGEGWRAAELVPGEGPYDWSDWSYSWSPARPGPTVVRARAADAQGEVQPESADDNDFQYGNNAIQSVPVVVE